MGVVRLYLALCVVAAHSSTLLPWTMHGGTESVQIFFMISGFYMALIADKYATKREFYASRFLRIYIPYLAVCVPILMFSIAAGLAGPSELSNKWMALSTYSTWNTEQNGIAGLLLATTANLTILGSDWILFLADEPSIGLTTCSNFHELPNPLCRYLVIPPAWSVGVELTFYILVPFLNKLSTKSLLGMVAASLLARSFVYEQYGMSCDPWTYRFFPFELALFGMGMCAYRYYAAAVNHADERHQGRNIAAYMDAFCRIPYWIRVVACLIAFWCSVRVVSLLEFAVPEHYGRFVMYLGWAIALPVLFHSTKSNRLDRYLGDLSYPLYLSHYFIVGLVAAVFTRSSIFAEWLRGPIVALISIVISVALLQWVVLPVERHRKEWAKKITLKRENLRTAWLTRSSVS